MNMLEKMKHIFKDDPQSYNSITKTIGDMAGTLIGNTQPTLSLH